jgi:inorganic triphosphatase YgiF
MAGSIRPKDMSREIEIRFAVTPDDLARLKNVHALKAVGAGRSATRRLSTVYYDTQKLGFAKAGLSLRVRKTGRSYVQTVKNETTGALASERGEYESRLPSPKPNLTIPSKRSSKRIFGAQRVRSRQSRAKKSSSRSIKAKFAPWPTAIPSYP